MSVKAYKVEKSAKGPSFKPNDLLEYIFEDIGVAFYGGDDEKYFVWLDEEDLDELEEWLDKHKTGDLDEEEDDYDKEDEDQEESDEDEIEFDEEDIKETRRVLEIIRKDLADKKSVMYIVW